MPHQCVRCNTFHDDGAAEILKGCPCGGKLFFYVKKEKLEQSKKLVVSLSKNEKKQIEEDVREIIGAENEDGEEPVVLDMEAIRIRRPGQYDIDLMHLFKNEPLVYKVGEGKYLIDIIRSFGGKEKGRKTITPGS